MNNKPMQLLTDIICQEKSKYKQLVCNHRFVYKMQTINMCTVIKRQCVSCGFYESIAYYGPWQIPVIKCDHCGESYSVRPISSLHICDRCHHRIFLEEP